MMDRLHSASAYFRDAFGSLLVVSKCVGVGAAILNLHLSMRHVGSTAECQVRNWNRDVYHNIDTMTNATSYSLRVGRTC